ncbi:MAG: hypothetical protein ACREQ2_00175 [Candidatus Binatia bacterium]
MTDISEGSTPELLERIVACFRRERVPYALIGAWALSVWGTSRATNDVDFLVLVDEEELSRVSDRVIDAGFELDETWLKWNPMLRGVQLRFQFHGTTADLLRPRDTHDQQVFQRRRKRRMDGRYYWLVSPEDFIIQKLKVGRPRDFEDALSVLERSGKALDKRYLQRWAGRTGVSAELHYIVSL